MSIYYLRSSISHYVISLPIEGLNLSFPNLAAIIWGLLPICVAVMAHFYLQMTV